MSRAARNPRGRRRNGQPLTPAQRRHGALLGLCTWMAVACEPGAPTTGPSGPLGDPAAVSAGLATVNGAFGTPAIQSLVALGALMSGAAAAPPPVLASSSPLACAIQGAGAAPATTSLPLSIAGLIADSLHGRVFAYDTTLRSYRATSDSSGPSAGVRFLLYAVDSFAQPIRPLSQDGWLDLVDQSLGAALKLRAHVTNGTSDDADYTVTPAGTQAADTALLVGTVTDGHHLFAFRDSTASASFQTTVSAMVVDSIDDLHIAMFAARISFDPFDFNDSLEFTFVHAAQTIQLAGHIDTYCMLPLIGLNVVVNGADFATVTNGATTPNFARVDGQPITAGQVQAIQDLMTTEQQLHKWLGAFFAPPKLLLPRN